MLSIVSCGGGTASDSPGSNKPSPGDTSASSLSAVAESSAHSNSVAASSMQQASSIASSNPSSASSVGAVFSSSAYIRLPRSSAQASSISNIDNQAPENTHLLVYKIAQDSILLIWDYAVDNTGVEKYIIRRNGEIAATLDATTNLFSDTELVPGAEYNYTITTVDSLGNASPESNTLSVRTLGKPSGSTSSIHNSSTSSLFIISSSASNTASSVNSSPVASSTAAISSSAPQSSSSRSSAVISSSSYSSASISSSSYSSSKVASSTSSSSASPLTGIRTVTITWSHPTQRENGSFLELDDIGGYEIRYRKPTDKNFTYFVISGNRTTEFSYTADFTGAEFQIAVYDSSGLYSNFVPVMR